MVHAISDLVQASYFSFGRFGILDLNLAWYKVMVCSGQVLDNALHPLVQHLGFHRHLSYPSSTNIQPPCDVGAWVRQMTVLFNSDMLMLPLIISYLMYFLAYDN